MGGKPYSLLLSIQCRERKCRGPQLLFQKYLLLTWLFSLEKRVTSLIGGTGETWGRHAFCILYSFFDSDKHVWLEFLDTRQQRFHLFSTHDSPMRWYYYHALLRDDKIVTETLRDWCSLANEWHGQVHSCVHLHDFISQRLCSVTHLRSWLCSAMNRPLRLWGRQKKQFRCFLDLAKPIARFGRDGQKIQSMFFQLAISVIKLILSSLLV